MAHLSEKTTRLSKRIFRKEDSLNTFYKHTSSPDIWLTLLPQDFSAHTFKFKKEAESFLKNLSQNIHQDSVVAILCSFSDAPEIFTKLSQHLYFKLWIAIKLKAPLFDGKTLPANHAALLVLTKYNEPLRHTKTKIAYTYCPICKKTTKDYGGKKHLYHEYGTLMSDVWRDIVYDPNEYPNDIILRIQDLFSIAPYKFLNIINFCEKNIHNKKYKLPLPAAEPLIISSSSNKKYSNSRLINEDCLSALKELPNNSVHFCFADPPYNLNKKYLSWNDNIDIQDYFDWCDSWLSELSRVLRPGGTCAVVNIPQWSIRHFNHLKKFLKFQDWIVWEGLSLPVRMIMPAHYSILCFSKGTPRDLPGLSRENHSYLEAISLNTTKEFYCTRSSCIKERRSKGICDKDFLTNLWWDIHRLKHNSRRVDHPCQLPPTLMHRLISLFTYENELVLDPFNATGTTSLAAEQLNREFIGIELSKKYHSIAQKRHKELRMGLNPFRKQDQVPSAKNSPVKRLEKKKYEVSKKILQLEVKNIMKKIGRLPTRDDVKKMSKYPINYFDEYFISWGEVCAAARTTGMNEVKSGTKKSSDKASEELPLF